MHFCVNGCCTISNLCPLLIDYLGTLWKVSINSLYTGCYIICIFRSDLRQDSLELNSAPVIENPEHQTLWYSKYFLGKFHHNFVGQDLSDKSTYVLSVVEEKSFGKSHCRSILWTKDGPKRLVSQGSQKSKSPKTILGQYGLSFDHPFKEVSC